MTRSKAQSLGVCRFLLFRFHLSVDGRIVGHSDIWNVEGWELAGPKCAARNAKEAYSARNASIGSTRVARRAGTYDASIAVTNITIAEEHNVQTSCALTP